MTAERSTNARAGLGVFPASRVRPGEWLTEAEAKELLCRAAVVSDFTPLSDHSSTRTAKKTRLWLDCAWMPDADAAPVAVFHVAGPKAGEQELRRNVRRFEIVSEAVPDALRILVLVHLSTKCAPLGRGRKEPAKLILRNSVTHVLYDYELMAAGGIESISLEAKAISARRLRRFG